MISLQKSLSEFDKMRSLERAALECYCSAIRTAEQYLVEVNTADARDTRTQLHDVLDAAERSTSPEPLTGTRSRFRALLRDYQERAQAQIARLRDDLESALTAMQSPIR